jgi:hypothetical protein
LISKISLAAPVTVDPCDGSVGGKRYGWDPAVMGLINSRRKFLGKWMLGKNPGKRKYNPCGGGKGGKNGKHGKIAVFGKHGKIGKLGKHGKIGKLGKHGKIGKLGKGNRLSQYGKLVPIHVVEDPVINPKRPPPRL